MGKAFHTAHRWELEWQDDTDVTLGPEGCVVFASVRGPSSLHRYEGPPAGDI